MTVQDIAGRLDGLVTLAAYRAGRAGRRPDRQRHHRHRRHRRKKVTKTMKVDRHQGRPGRHRRAPGRRHALRAWPPTARSTPSPWTARPRRSRSSRRCCRPASGATVDFNPVADRLRVIGSDGTSLRVNVDDGKVIKDGSLKYADTDANKGKTPKIMAGAYTNSVKGTKETDAVQHRPRRPARWSSRRRRMTASSTPSARSAPRSTSSRSTSGRTAPRTKPGR